MPIALEISDCDPVRAQGREAGRGTECPVPSVEKHRDRSRRTVVGHGDVEIGIAIQVAERERCRGRPRRVVDVRGEQANRSSEQHRYRVGRRDQTDDVRPPIGVEIPDRDRDGIAPGGEVERLEGAVGLAKPDLDPAGRAEHEVGARACVHPPDRDRDGGGRRREAGTALERAVSGRREDRDHGIPGALVLAQHRQLVRLDAQGLGEGQPIGFKRQKWSSKIRLGANGAFEHGEK